MNDLKIIVKKKPQSWIGIWIALVAGIGVPMENIPYGVGIGFAIGFLFFLIFRFKRN